MQRTYGDSVLPALGHIIAQRESPARLVGFTCSALVNYLDGFDDLPAPLQKHAEPMLDGLLSIIDMFSTRDDAKMRAMSALSALVAVLAQAGQLPARSYSSAMSIMWPFIDGQTEADVKARALDAITIIGQNDRHPAATGPG